MLFFTDFAIASHRPPGVLQLSEHPEAKREEQGKLHEHEATQQNDVVLCSSLTARSYSSYPERPSLHRLFALCEWHTLILER
jgi:hypothetical protein